MPTETRRAWNEASGGGSPPYTPALRQSFERVLKTGEETTVKLLTPVPVHLVYFTAYPSAKGEITYARDIYGRDAALFQALTEAGVVLGGVQG